MRNIDGLTVGRIDASVSVALRSSREWAGLFGFALITSIDSSQDLRRVRSALTITQEIAGATFLGSGLLVPASGIAQVAERFKMFTGFDEVWFFPGKPRSSKPSELYLVAPLDLETEPPPEGLARWCAESGCQLGLGDGIGMNFATPDRQIASKVQQFAVTV
jgi:hypothetical protein